MSQDKLDLHNIVIIGTGNVGKALLKQLADILRNPARPGWPAPAVVAIANERGIAFQGYGFSSRVLDALAEKDEIEKLRYFSPLQDCGIVRQVRGRVKTDALTFVDVTAADLTNLHLEALRLGHAVVTANKKPLTASMDVWQELMSYGPRRYRFECTVGAGLPVISTLQNLIATGDRIREITAMPSGSLGYILGQLDTGNDSPKRAAMVVLDAIEKGFAKPDPRDDLSLMDTRRKALILGRLYGLELELGDVFGLNPAVSHKGMQASPDVFRYMLERGEGVEPLAELIQNQRWREKNCLTRCVVTMNHIRPIVRLTYVDEHSDIGRLHGTKNYFSITTDRYNKVPLTITGPGAGPEVTAAGVLADILEIVR